MANNIANEKFALSEVCKIELFQRFANRNEGVDEVPLQNSQQLYCQIKP